MDERDLAFTPAWRLRDLIARRKVSPVEVTEVFLQRIQRLNPLLHAYLTVSAEEALSQARRAEEAVMRGEDLGPLHGIPVSLKDLLWTQGIRTTGGSLVYRDFVPPEDSPAAQRVRRAGAIILGKTNTPEFGLSGTTENRLADPCRTPWDLTRTSGGSSGGAGAAVAAGLGPLAIGTDGAGSIRIPASFCGIYGLKPTRGRVPRYGGFGGWPLFSVIGPMTRTVPDAALLLQVLAGPDPRDPTCLRQRPPNFLRGLRRGIRGLRIAWSPDLGYAAVEPEVVAVCRQAAQTFQEGRALIEEVVLDWENPFPYLFTVAGADTFASLGHLLEQADLLTRYCQDVLSFGVRVTGADYSRALRWMEQFAARVEAFFERYDLLLTPTLAVPSFPVGQRPEVIAGRPVDRVWGFFPFTYPFNITGQPAASVPCGFSREGLPIGLQIVGRRGEEALVLRASFFLEEARPWAHQIPPVS